MRTPLAALAVLVAVACAGCSDDPEPDFAPPESTSPAPTDPTTSSTTTEPAELTPGGDGAGVGGGTEHHCPEPADATDGLRPE